MNNGADTTEAGSSDCTCLRVRKAARRVSQLYDQHLAPSGLTITQFGLLGHLKAFRGISIGALAEKLLMDPTTLTRNLRPLERRGLIVIEADPRDRRARRLHLTADGLQAFKEAKPSWERAQRHIREALGGADTAALHAALERVLQQLG